MELNLKILAPLLQCTSIYRYVRFITVKKNINFLFCVHITFLFFYSFSISFFVSLSSLPLHLFFLPPQTFSPSPISQAQPPTLLSIADLTSLAADPFLHRRSHKLSRHRPFSSSPISQAQPPQTLPFRFALILFWSRRTKPHRWRRNRAVSIS